MPSQWPLRTKLKLGLGVFLISFLALFGSAVYGLYAYRGLVMSLSGRSAELPLASEIQQRVNDLRVILSQANERAEFPQSIQSFTEVPSENDEPQSLPWDAKWLRNDYRDTFVRLVEAIDRYRLQLDVSSLDRDLQLGDDSLERQTLAEIDQLIDELGGKDSGSELGEDWVLRPNRIEYIRGQLDEMRDKVEDLPSYLHGRLEDLSDNVRAQYRTAIFIAWVNAGIALVLIFVSIRGFIRWFAEPLQTLVNGSRQVALGKFDHRIHLESSDEMGELAVAMNNMTARFQEIRDDLDRQVRERTSQVVRSEQLASVGFLAAGVAHEINNPLASIALCSESLDSRIEEMMANADSPCKEDAPVIHNYLQMIQREAFRCKQITEKLLDFARMGDSQRVRTDLRELVAGVIDMVQHLGKHKDKNLELAAGPPVVVEINAQEIKQVVLNLITNGLESLDSSGTVLVAVEQEGDLARIIVEDDGCGMSDEVRKHLFEPFFTRRRGGQGTGLGLSITYRIVEEHDGNIEATSAGAGCGSRFVVSLPSQHTTKEKNHRYQAA